MVVKALKDLEANPMSLWSEEWARDGDLITFWGCIYVPQDADLLHQCICSHVISLNTPLGHNHPRATTQGNVPCPLYYHNPIHRKQAHAASPPNPGPSEPEPPAENEDANTLMLIACASQ